MYKDAYKLIEEFLSMSKSPEKTILYCDKTFLSKESVKISPIRIAITMCHADLEVRGDKNSRLSPQGRRQAQEVVESYQEALLKRSNLDIPLIIAICDSGLLRTLEMSIIQVTHLDRFVKRFQFNNLYIMYLGSFEEFRSTDTFPVLMRKNSHISPEDAFLNWMMATDEENRQRGVKTTSQTASDITNLNIAKIEEVALRGQKMYNRQAEIHLWNNNHEANVGALVKHYNLAHPSEWEIKPAEFVITEIGPDGRNSYRFRDRYQKETSVGLIDLTQTPPITP